MMMPQNSPSRLSRETRRLLTAALIAIVALWGLARVRFPDQPATPNPIPSLLSQLSAAPRFASLASEIAELQTRLSGGWLPITALLREESGHTRVLTVPALRVSPDVAVLLPGEDVRPADESSVLARGRASGLTVIRVDSMTLGPAIVPWVPPTLDSPRYLMATTATPGGVSLTPVLVGSLFETRSPAWPGPVWLAPRGSELEPGAFVFTASGEIAGLVIDEPAGPAIVPWDFVSAEATRLLVSPSDVRGDLRVEVQPLSDALSRATGSPAGVVVAWIDPSGPAVNRLEVGDVIEALNGQPVASLRDWAVAESGLPAGSVTLQVRRNRNIIPIAVTVSPPDDLAPRALGLTMRSRPGVGAAVVGVAPRSAGSAAGLQAGDVITRLDGVQAPTPSQVEEAFESTAPGGALLLGITRAQAHIVVGLER